MASQMYHQNQVPTILASFVHVEASLRTALLFSLAFTFLSRVSWLMLSTQLSMLNILVGGGYGWKATQLTWWLCFVHALVGSLEGGILFRRGVWVILLK